MNQRGGNGANRRPSEGEADRKKDAADYLDFLSSEFMTRLGSGGRSDARRQSQWKRSFEDALERRKQKQARSDEFFEIYRRATLLPRSAQRTCDGKPEKDKNKTEAHLYEGWTSYAFMPARIFRTCSMIDKGW